MTDSGQPAIFRIGDVLNNTYRIEAALGRGGTSEVYRARSEISGHQVALKALRSEFSANEDFLALMTREEAIREVRHDAIVRYYHNQRTDDGVVFLVMDYVHGVGLDRKLKEGGMSAADLLTVATRVTEGLQAAHARNITHRDLSPDNIILRNGDPADAVIIDFGIAKDSNPGAGTVVGNEFAGKYAYAAPEQLNGKSDARSDIYALGALLLATFRGAAPDVGTNPMDVVERKMRPLDTSGLPEPLKGLIDRMTVPDRDKRVPDATTLLALLRAATAPPPADFDPDATVIAPLPEAAAPPGSAPTAAPRPAPPPPPEPAASPPRQGRGGLIAALALVLLVALGAGGYFGGLFGPSLPTVDPFTLNIAHAADGTLTAEGYVPTQEVYDALSDHIAGRGGQARLTLAHGPVGADWGAGVTSLLDFVAPLDEARIAIVNDSAEVTGLTENRSLYDQLTASLAQPGIVPGLAVSSALELGPRMLPVARVAGITAGLADCGELTLPAAPPVAYPQGARITVSGRVAQPETRSALRDAILAVAGDRDVAVDTEVLNPTLCAIDAVLPDAPPAGFDISFSNGETGEGNASGRFFIGENPVIDVTIPADVTDGFLIVSALDVSGNVFQLLPNLNRPDNRIAELRNGETGPVTIRVAYTLAESERAGGAKIAFVVDGDTLGKSRIMVIQAESDILDGLRPTTESAASFAAALSERSGAVRSLDSRILTTAQP